MQNNESSDQSFQITVSVFTGGLTNVKVAYVITSVTDLIRLHDSARQSSDAARAALRAGERDFYDVFKKRLPYITPAVFDPPRRRKDAVTGAGLIIIDIDTPSHGDTAQSLYDRAKGAGVPPLYTGATGKGFRLYYGLERMITGDHTAVIFKAIYEHLTLKLREAGVETDDAMCKPEQAALVWFDPSAVWDLEATPLPVPELEQLPHPVQETSQYPRLELPPEKQREITLTNEYTALFTEPTADLAILRENQPARAMFTYAWARAFGEGGREAFVELICYIRNGQHPERVLRAKANQNYNYGLRRTDYFATRLDAYSFVRAVALKCNVRLPLYPLPPPALTLTCNEFISEIQGEIESSLRESNIIQAPTGAGKTTWVIKFCEQRVKEFTDNEVALIVVPRAVLATDVAERARAAGVIAGDVRAGVRTKMISKDISEGCRIFCCTADSLHKISQNELVCKLLIVDEAHDVIPAAGFRARAMNLLQDQIEMTEAAGGQIIYLTATPQRPLFECLDVKAYIKVCRTLNPQYHFTAVNAQTEYLFEFIRQNSQTVGILEINRKGYGRRGVHPYVERLTALGITAFGVTRDSVNEIERFRQHIKTNGNGWLITTCVAEMGLDINANGLDCIVIHQIEQNDLEPSKLAQVAGRLRGARSVKLYVWQGGRAEIYTPSDLREPTRNTVRIGLIEREVLAQQIEMKETINAILACDTPVDETDPPPPVDRFRSVFYSTERRELKDNRFEIARNIQGIISVTGGLHEYLIDLGRYINVTGETGVKTESDFDDFDNIATQFEQLSGVIDDVIGSKSDLEYLAFISGWNQMFDLSKGTKAKDDLNSYERFVEPANPVAFIQGLLDDWIELQVNAQMEKAAQHDKPNIRKRILNKIPPLREVYNTLRGNDLLIRHYLDAKIGYAIEFHNAISTLPKIAKQTDALQLTQRLRGEGVTALKGWIPALKFFVWFCSGCPAPNDLNERVWLSQAYNVWMCRDVLYELINDLTPAAESDDGAVYDRKEIDKIIRKASRMTAVRRVDLEAWLNLIYEYISTSVDLEVADESKRGGSTEDHAPTCKKRMYVYRLQGRRKGLSDFGLDDLERRLLALPRPQQAINHTPPSRAEIIGMTAAAVQSVTNPPAPELSPIPEPPPAPEPFSHSEPVCTPEPLPEPVCVTPPVFEPILVPPPTEQQKLFTDDFDRDVRYRRIESIPKTGHPNYVELISCTGKRYTIKTSPCIGNEIKIFERVYEHTPE